MISFARTGLVLLALSLGLLLSGCEGFDPTSFMDYDFFNTKKRLPGDRKPVFPEGTPGVPQGVPNELMKGYQPAEQAEERQPTAQAVSSEPKRFTVAIIGRPNVGKSTLFNRLVGKRLALVDDLPGVTRDRREAQARLGDLTFTAIDTAGLEEATPESLSGRMQEQTQAAIDAADALMFLIDARAGSTPADRAFADLVRKSGKPAILIANKSEGSAAEAGILEAYELGLGEPIAISAEHGEGLADLYDGLRAALPDATAPEMEVHERDLGADIDQNAASGMPI